MPEAKDPSLPSVPEAQAVVKRRARISLVWLVPIVAAAAGVWVTVARIVGEGPKIAIVLQSAEGLEAGKTKIRYNGVEVGVVDTIRLSDDHQTVVGTAQMAPKTESFLVADTSFWVVRPRVSGTSVTGLGTLISGAYIGMEIGHSHERKREFQALDRPPVVTADVAGRFFVLETSDLGSLDNGTPVFFRRLQVGQVADYELNAEGTALTLKVFIDAPYDQYVTSNTRFWHASGIDLSVSAAGMKLQTQSLASIVAGGIAFATPATGPDLPPAEPNTVFTLYPDRTEAFKLPARDPQTYLLVFTQAVRGLAVGAPVEFHGIPIGEVVEVRAQFDARTYEFSAPVIIRVDPESLGVEMLGMDASEDSTAVHHRVMDALIAHGARAQLRTGSLVTGALYVALDYMPDASAATVDWSKTPPQLPTVPSQFEAVEASLVNVVKKLEQVPFQEIGQDLRKTIADLDRTIVSVGRTVDNADKLIEPNSPLSAELSNTLGEMTRAAQALRVLADYLERHPEALIRGKTGESK